MPACAQSQDRHAKCRGRVSAGLTKPEKLIKWNLQLSRKIGEITDHHFPWECIVPRRDRRMGGKDVGRSDNLQGEIEIEVVLSHMQTNAPQQKEGRVPFINIKAFRSPTEAT